MCSLDYKYIFLLCYYMVWHTKVKIYYICLFLHTAYNCIRTARKLAVSFAQSVINLTHLPLFLWQNKCFGVQGLARTTHFNSWHLLCLSNANLHNLLPSWRTGTEPQTHFGWGESLDWLRNYTCFVMTHAPLQAHISGTVLVGPAGSIELTSLRTVFEGGCSANPAKRLPFPSIPSSRVAENKVLPVESSKQLPVSSYAGLRCEGKTEPHGFQVSFKRKFCYLIS